MSEPSTSSSGPVGEARVSTLVGARLCAGCGFDLCGQPVVREPHYKMLMVRCPECATVAGLQEYPQRTRWIGRLTGLWVAAWLMVLIIAALVSAALLNTAANSTARTMVSGYAAEIAVAYNDHLQRTPVPSPGNVYNPWQQNGPPSADWWVDETWWARASDATLGASGGAFHATRWPLVAKAVYDLPMAVLIGLVWSVALLHVRRRRVLVLAAVLALVALFLNMLSWGQLRFFMGSNRPAAELAMSQMGTFARVAALGVLAGGVMVGLWIGRPLARWAVRILLPPRLWGSLSLLWIEEGLTPPSPARK